MLIPTGLNIHEAIIVSTGLVYWDILHEPVAVITNDGDITQRFVPYISTRRDDSMNRAE
jgi:hypothetical protein